MYNTEQKENLNLSEKKAESLSGKGSSGAAGSVSSMEGDIMYLQRAIGNSGVESLLMEGVSVSSPNDAYEREADKVAGNVVQRMHEAGQVQSGGNNVQLKSLQRKVSRKNAETGGGVSGGSGIMSQIENSRPSGHSLSPLMRSKMENAFSASFENVRIHNDSRADTLSRSLDARAFTTGSDIFFRKGEYNPSDRGGQELIAHELTHVVQQSPEIQRWPWSKKSSTTSAPPSPPPTPAPPKKTQFVRFVEGVKAGPASGRENVSRTREKMRNVNEASGDVLEGVDNVVGSPTDAVGGMTSSIGKAVGDSKAEDVGGGMGVIGIFSSIKGAFDTASSTYRTFKHLLSKEKSAKETAEDITDIVSNLTDTVSSVLSTVETLYDLVAGVESVLPAGLIPGLGIVTSGISLIRNMIKVMQSYQSSRKADRMMTKMEQSDNAVSTLSLPPEQSKWYKSKKSETRGRRKTKVNEELQTLSGRTGLTTDEEQKKGSLRKYKLIGNLQTLSKKRIDRGALNIASDLLKLSGNLTNVIAGASGIGAAVGTSLGVGGSMLKLGAKGVRVVKQFGRDRGWWGDGTKTSQAKNAQYASDAEQIMQMVRALPDFDSNDDDIIAQYAEVEDIVDLTGVRLVKLLRHTGEPDTQKEILIDAMKKRE